METGTIGDNPTGSTIEETGLSVGLRTCLTFILPLTVKQNRQHTQMESTLQHRSSLLRP